jgi:hypothetical protein
VFPFFRDLAEESMAAYMSQLDAQSEHEAITPVVYFVKLDNHYSK